MSDWTDELRAQVIEAYEKADPTPENSVEIVKELAEEFEKTPNGIRMVLTKANVYIKKEAATGGTTKATGTKTGTARVSKADSIDSLATAIKAVGLDPDMEILTKLTGKAAIYIKDVIEAASADKS